MEIPTVKIALPDGSSRVINRSDFDPATMTIRFSGEPKKEEAALTPNPEKVVQVKNPKDRRQRIRIPQSTYDKNPAAWELWE